MALHKDDEKNCHENEECDRVNVYPCRSQSFRPDLGWVERGALLAGAEIVWGVFDTVTTSVGVVAEVVSQLA